MDLNSFCIIPLSAAILLVSYTQYRQTETLWKLRNKVEDLRCRLNKRTEQQTATAKELRKEEKAWRIHDLEETRERCFDIGSALHASEICSFLTDVEKGILLSVRRWQLFVNKFQPNTYICDTMHPVFTPEAQEILMKPLLEAYRSGQVKHIDDFDLVRISPSYKNDDKTKEE